MKSTAFGRVLEKLAGIDRTSRAVEALEAASHHGQAPEDPGGDPKGPPDAVPAAHRPELPDAATGFCQATGLPLVAMDRFPLPHDEEDAEADACV